MEYLVSKYNEYIEKVAPELGEEVIFSSRMKKYLLITHYEDCGADVLVIENAEQFTEELMLSIAFHFGGSLNDKLSKHELKEEMIKEILNYKKVLSEYLILSNALINAVCMQALAAYYNEQ